MQQKLRYQFYDFHFKQMRFLTQKQINFIILHACFHFTSNAKKIAIFKWFIGPRVVIESIKKRNFNVVKNIVRLFIVFKIVKFVFFEFLRNCFFISPLFPKRIFQSLLYAWKKVTSEPKKYLLIKIFSFIGRT